MANKQLLERLKQGDKSVLNGLSPLASLRLGMQLKNEEQGKTEETKIDLNKIGEVITGINSDRKSIKYASTTYFKAKEETPQ